MKKWGVSGLKQITVFLGVGDVRVILRNERGVERQKTKFSSDLNKSSFFWGVEGMENISRRFRLQKCDMCRISGGRRGGLSRLEKMRRFAFFCIGKVKFAKCRI